MSRRVDVLAWLFVLLIVGAVIGAFVLVWQMVTAAADQQWDEATFWAVALVLLAMPTGVRS